MTKVTGADQSKIVRWGVFGTGLIADRFCSHLLQSGASRLHGVASRQFARAQAHAQKFAARAYTSYAELCESPEVDIIYIATPTFLHREHCLLALSQGKAVLCEKPFTLNAESAAEVVAFAAQQGLFCMEAMWMRFNPGIQELRDLILTGGLGSVRSLRADVGWTKPDFSERTREDSGALHTFGCYALSLAWYLLGPPSGYSASLVRNSHGVDIDCGMLLDYPTTVVTLAATIAATQTNEAAVFGSGGTAVVKSPFIDAVAMEVTRHGQPPSTLSQRLSRRFRRSGSAIQPGAGLDGEIAECIRCLSQGLTESPVMPLGETVAIHEYLDRIRAAPG